MEREKLRSHEDTVRLSAEKGRLDRTLTGAELELAEAQRQIQLLEVQPLATPSLPSPGPGPHPCPRPECQTVPGAADGSASPGSSTSITHEPRLLQGTAQSKVLEGGVLPRVERRNAG